MSKIRSFIADISRRAESDPIVTDRIMKHVTFPLPRMDFQLRKSPLGGFGCFATKNFSKNETIEIVRKIIFPSDQVKTGDVLYDYIHEDQKGYCSLHLGYADQYNHSDDPNAAIVAADYNGYLVGVKALKKIKCDEEILVSYGPDWFSARQKVTNSYKK